MSDLISRQAVLSLPKDIVRNMSGEIIEEFVNLEAVKALPSAQPETMYYPQVDGVTPSVIVQPERKKGMWISDGDPATWVCSNCGYRVTGYNNTKFCPNCGADMRDE